MATVRASFIEPWLTDQWYVDAKSPAQPALAAVREGKTKFVPKKWAEDLLRLARQYPALVHLAPALVGASDPGVVWAGRQKIFVADIAKRGRRETPPRCETRSIRRLDASLCRRAEGGSRSDARRRRPRHLVLLGALAVFDARLAGRDAGAEALSIRPMLSSPASTSSSSGSPA